MRSQPPLWLQVIVAAALGGLLCGLLGQPVLLGYIAAGMLVGPGGLGLVHELVQVETLAQFGVVFLLFALGVEFSIVKMQGVQAVAIGGGTLQIVVAMVLGGMLGSTVTQGVFVGEHPAGLANIRLIRMISLGLASSTA